MTAPGNTLNDQIDTDNVSEPAASEIAPTEKSALMPTATTIQFQEEDDRDKTKEDIGRKSQRTSVTLEKLDADGDTKAADTSTPASKKQTQDTKNITPALPPNPREPDPQVTESESEKEE
jgi:hypothetical protein